MVIVAVGKISGKADHFAAIDHCLAKDPGQRYASTDELAGELRRARDGGAAAIACAACGRDNDARHQFCSHCGAELVRGEGLGAEAGPKNPAQEPPERDLDAMMSHLSPALPKPSKRYHFGPSGDGL